MPSCAGGQSTWLVTGSPPHQPRDPSLCSGCSNGLCPPLCLVSSLRLGAQPLLPGGEVGRAQEPESWSGGVGSWGHISLIQPHQPSPGTPLKRSHWVRGWVCLSPMEPTVPSAPQEFPFTPLPRVVPLPCAGVGSEVKTG